MAARKKVGRAGSRKSTAKKATKVDAAAAAPERPAARKATRKAASKNASAAKVGKAATSARARSATAARGKGGASKASGAAKAKAALGKGKASVVKAEPVVSAFPEIEELAGLMDRFDLLEVRYSSDGDGATKIHVSRRGSGAPAVHHATSHAGEAPAPVAAAAAPAEPVEVVPTVDESLVPFKSPMVGTFYRAPSPEAPPFASVGDKVDLSSVVCIIEAMKVMNEIMPDVSGEIVSIEVENGEAVEFGQTLMLLRPR